MSYKRILMSLILILVTQCSLLEEKKAAFNIDYPPELNQINNLILEKKTDDARLKIDDYLNKSENIHWFGHAYFMKAFLYEMDDNYTESVKHYRSAIEHSSQYDSKIEAKALYNLSFVFEKMNKKSELLVCLIDLMKRREYFDILTGQVEIPARLAAVYFALEKTKEAKIFHREASQNFESMVRRKHFASSKEELSKSLYYLGVAVYDPNDEKFDFLIKKLTLGQKYFLASVEASKSSWADKSTDRLLGEYSKLWNFIKSYQVSDSTLDKQAQNKQTHMRQLEMASDFYDLIHRLRVEEFPMLNVNRRSKELMSQSKKWLSKLEKFSLQLNLGPEMTRNQRVKNKKLSKFIIEKKEPVKVNKEISESKVETPLGGNIKKVPAEKLEEKDGSTELPPKIEKTNDIGVDPNL